MSGLLTSSEMQGVQDPGSASLRVRARSCLTLRRVLQNLLQLPLREPAVEGRVQHGSTRAWHAAQLASRPEQLCI